MINIDEIRSMQEAGVKAENAKKVAWREERYDAIRAIKQCFCDAYNVYCPNCPMHKYRISKSFAVCYYGNRPYSSTEKQINRFLAVARVYWKREWDGRLNNSMRKILGVKAKVV